MYAVPDFDDEFDEDKLTLTPRQRHVVARVANELADTILADAHKFGDSVVESGLCCAALMQFPQCTWGQDAKWWRTMAYAFEYLAADAIAGGDPEPRCTGEEMALHLIIGRARTAITEDRFLQEIVNLPANERDDDWDGPLDYLFQDHDVLTLFSPEPVLDGINLDPADWFTPFDGT